LGFSWAIFDESSFLLNQLVIGKNPQANPWGKNLKIKNQKRFDLLRLGHLCSSEVIEHWVRDARDKGLADNNTERGKLGV
jgi:hypothetical protein